MKNIHIDAEKAHEYRQNIERYTRELAKLHEGGAEHYTPQDRRFHIDNAKTMRESNLNALAHLVFEALDEHQA